MQRINTSVPKDVLDNISIGQEITFSAYASKTVWSGKNQLITLFTGKNTIGALKTDKCEGDKVREGAYVRVTGTVHEEKRAECGYEIRLKSIKVLSASECDYPVNIFSSDTGCTTEEAIPYRNIMLKREDTRKPFIFASKAQMKFCSFMTDNDFIQVHSPVIVPFNIKRGPHEFKLDYFGHDAVLSKSPQMYMQSCAASFGRVFEITHSYRAQKHYSTRHLNEFISLNFEMSYVNTLFDVLNATAGAVLKMADTDGEIPAFTFYEVCDILNKAKTDIDLNPTEELKLYEYVKENFRSEFVFVTNFPEDKRPLYEKNLEGNPRLTDGFSLIYRGMEIASGGIHIHSYNEQVEKLIRLGKNPDDFSEYLNLHKFGLPPQGGATIGLERFVQKHLLIDNIKEASLFVRDIHNITP